MSKRRGRKPSIPTIIDNQGRKWRIVKVVSTGREAKSPKVLLPTFIAHKLGLKVGDYAAFYFNEEKKCIYLRKVKVTIEFEE